MWPTSTLGPQNTEDRGATWIWGYEQAAENMGNVGRQAGEMITVTQPASDTFVMPSGHAEDGWK